MESDQNQVHLTTAVSAKDTELNYVSSPSNHDAQSPMMLESWSDMEDNNGPRKKLLRREDATESNLDEVMDHLIGILGETITILGADVNDDDDSDYYAVCDPKGLSETVVSGDAIVEEQKSRNNHSVGCQTEATGETMMGIAVSKNGNGTRNELNEIAESLMIVLMLFSLYFLLSSMV